MILVITVFGEFALKFLVEQTLSPLVAFAGSFLIWSLFFYLSFVEIFFSNERAQHRNYGTMVRFVLRNGGLLTLPAIPIFLFLLFNITLLSPEDDTVSLDTTRYIKLSIILTFGVMSLFVYGIMGTILPAIVVDASRGLRKALNRGKALFSLTFGQLLFGPGLVYILLNIAYFSASPLIDVSVQFSLDGVTHSLGYLLLNITYNIGQAWILMMIAWILSKEFLAFENKDIEILSPDILYQNAS